MDLGAVGEGSKIAISHWLGQWLIQQLPYQPWSTKCWISL